MTFHHGLAILAIIAAPVIVAGVIVFEASFRKAPLRDIALAVPIAMVLALLLVVPVALSCSDSQDISLAAPNLLSPEELQTLRGTGPFCPTIYRFKRDGEETCLVSDADGGASVGCG